MVSTSSAVVALAFLPSFGVGAASALPSHYFGRCCVLRPFLVGGAASSSCVVLSAIPLTRYCLLELSSSVSLGWCCRSLFVCEFEFTLNNVITFNQLRMTIRDETRRNADSRCPRRGHHISL